MCQLIQQIEISPELPIGMVCKFAIVTFGVRWPRWALCRAGATSKGREYGYADIESHSDRPKHILWHDRR